MDNETVVRNFLQKIWNEKHLESISQYVCSEYTIYLDAGDPWENKTLNNEEYKARLYHSFNSFPDIHFAIQTIISDNNCVTITWIMTGTNLGNIGEIAATKKAIRTNGATFYYLKEGKVCGHSQVFDRTTVMKQLGFGH